MTLRKLQSTKPWQQFLVEADITFLSVFFTTSIFYLILFSDNAPVRWDFFFISSFLEIGGQFETTTHHLLHCRHQRVQCHFFTYQRTEISVRVLLGGGGDCGWKVPQVLIMAMPTWTDADNFLALLLNRTCLPFVCQ